MKLVNEINYAVIIRWPVKNSQLCYTLLCPITSLTKNAIQMHYQMFLQPKSPSVWPYWQTTCIDVRLLQDWWASLLTGHFLNMADVAYVQTRKSLNRMQTSTTADCSMLFSTVVLLLLASNAFLHWDSPMAVPVLSILCNTKTGRLPITASRSHTVSLMPMIFDNFH